MSAAVGRRRCAAQTAASRACTRHGDWFVGSKRTWSWSRDKLCLQHAVIEARRAGRPHLWHGSTFEVRAVKDIPRRPRKPRERPVEGEAALARAFDDARTPAEFHRCRMALITQFQHLGNTPDAVRAAHAAAYGRIRSAS